MKTNPSPTKLIQTEDKFSVRIDTNCNIKSLIVRSNCVKFKLVKKSA